MSLLYHRNDFEHWSLCQTPRTWPSQSCFIARKHQVIYQLDGGSHPIAHSQLAACQEQAARSQQQTATTKNQPASSDPPPLDAQQPAASNNPAMDNRHSITISEPPRSQAPYHKYSQTKSNVYIFRTQRLARDSFMRHLHLCICLTNDTEEEILRRLAKDAWHKQSTNKTARASRDKPRKQAHTCHQSTCQLHGASTSVCRRN